MIPARKADRKIYIKHKKKSPHSFYKRKSVRIAGGCFIVLALTIIVVQLLYPWNKGLLFSRVGKEQVVLKKATDIASIINDQFDKTRIRLSVGKDKTVEVSLKSAGAEPNTDKMVNKVTDYPLWLRLIPGSLLVQNTVISADIFYSNTQLKVFGEQQSRVLSFAPKDARLEISDGKLIAKDAMSGSVVKVEALMQAIASADIKLGSTTDIPVPATRQTALHTSKDLEKVHGQANAVLGHTVSIQADGRSFLPDKKEIAGWVLLTKDTEGNVSLSIDRERIKKYLDTINKQVGTQAGQTDIEVVDGREIARRVGVSGRAIDSVKLADQIATSLLMPSMQVSKIAGFIETQPSIIFNSKYTTTQDGLQAYINDTARTKNMWIMVQQLDGNKWQASARAQESIPSGSTYKLFVALVLFDKIERGEIHWNDPMLDTTVAGCFERMTVASTNPCAEKWIANFGRQYINDFTHARGFSEGTSFTTGSANQTTAADLTKYMKGLNDGTLVNGQYRDRLLDSLGRHPYRYGIPTGSTGVVHDKVGFLWDYVHDTAIVKHNNETYLMTIMTKGQSYAAIAAVTRQIERIMYP